jgi:DNA-binding LytR/AlgR family response regulator
METKEKELLRRLVSAVGDCEDTDAVLAIAKDAAILLGDGDEIKYFREELNTLRLCLYRGATAAEYLIERFDQIYAKPVKAPKKPAKKKR